MARISAFQGKGGYLGVLEGTLGIWIENICFAKGLREKQSKRLPLFLLQEFCPLAGGGLLHQEEWRATPTMTQTDSLHLTASFAALHNNCGAATHMKKHLLPADFSPLQSFCNRTALEDGMRKESSFLFNLRNIMIILLFFSSGQGTGPTINHSFDLLDKWIILV